MQSCLITGEILITIPCLLSGGTEMQTFNLVRALHSGGYRVSVCCYYEYEDAIVDSFRVAGTEVILMKLDRSRGLLHLIRQMRTLLQEIKPDILHVQYMTPGFTPVIAARLSGIRTVLATVHQPGRTHGLKAKCLLRTAAILCNVFFCVSRAAEESWFGSSEVYEPEKEAKLTRKHYTVYNAVDVEQIKTLTKNTDGPALIKSLKLDKGPIIGVVGRLQEAKGQDILIRAMPAVVEAFPDAVLLIIGDGPDRSRFQNLAHRLGLQDHIQWTGQQDAESVMAYYAIMDVAVAPSRFEGFGLAAAEAMAAGLPVVASKVDGLCEVVEHNRTGYLVTPGNHVLLAEQIIDILSNPAKAATMGREGREKAAQHFSMDRFTQTILNVYRHFV